MRDLHQSGRCLALFIITVSMMLPLCSTASAQGNIIGDYELGIDQGLIVLDGKAYIKNVEAAIAQAILDDVGIADFTALQDSLDIVMRDDLMLASMWRPYTSVLLEREHPGLLLSNDVGSNANIVSMEISLGSNFNQFMPFGDGEYIQEKVSSGEYKLFDMNTFNFQLVDPDQVSISANVLDSGKRLSLSFSNGGIKPGHATTFNVYSSMGMLLENFFAADSQVTVVYEDPLTDEVKSNTSVLGGDINTFNDDLLSQLVAGTNRDGIHFRESVDPFLLSGGIVPEPTSLLLLGSGLGCFTLRRRRRAFSDKQ